MKRGEERRKVVRLLDMPLSALHEVSYRIISVDGDSFSVCRYSLLSARWIYCRRHGPARPFVASS